jgi:16S rRNA G966 N2-methylase RsmD
MLYVENLKCGFFDKYPEFYKTTKTLPIPNRLNSRYIALIEANKEIIKGRSVLDIASHDGRWSFAAIKNGASHVLGIEARDDLVKASYSNMEKYGIPEKMYSFISSDIFEEIKKVEKNTIDVVFCFGYFYHTLHHMLLLSEIKRLCPQYLIMDTGISSSEMPVIEVLEEDSEDSRMATPDPNISNRYVLTGIPSKKALEMMLGNARFALQYYDWNHDTIHNWEGIEDYQKKQRVTLLAKNLDRN